ncbi:pilus assembly protein PilM [Candidatus Peregrinibacteria bacterium]|nr:MAG: pilus assembly protein PilM [Candidatus Peregrinibacteria bacterium]
MSLSRLPKKLIGLDISSHALTAVEWLVKKDQLVLVNASKVELELGVVEDDIIINNPEAFKAALKQLIENGKNGPLKTKEVVIAIPEEKTFSHRITLKPEQKEDEEWIKKEAADFIPIELNQAIIDYYPIAGNDPKPVETALEFIAAQDGLVAAVIQGSTRLG